jgi:hypothetical protein
MRFMNYKKQSIFEVTWPESCDISYLMNSIRSKKHDL